MTTDDIMSTTSSRDGEKAILCLCPPPSASSPGDFFSCLSTSSSSILGSLRLSEKMPTKEETLRMRRSLSWMDSMAEAHW